MDGASAGFGELPQALVEDVLAQSLNLAGRLRGDLEKLHDEMTNIRDQAPEIRLDRDLGISQPKTSCGIDGSYLVERLLSTDLAAFAVLGIEGITPPSEDRHWGEPKHRAFVYPVGHHASTPQLIRGLMMAHEVDLAHSAPHEVVLLDYGMRTPMIYLNNATSNFGKKDLSEDIRNAFANQIDKAMDAYLAIARGVRPDKIYAAVPKYTSLRELTARMKLEGQYDDRSIATHILNPGEYIKPMPLEPWDDLHLAMPQSLADDFPELKRKRDDLVAVLSSRTYVTYYKPRKYLPAFRLEMAEPVVTNESRLGALLKTVEYQCSVPSVFEPFPLYLADRMVKHLPRAFPAFRQAVTHDMASNYKGDIAQVYLGMHSYRSESGR